MARQVLTLPDVPATLLTEAEATTTYLTQANAATTYLPLSHQPGADVHPQYYNQSRGDARYLQISTAASTYQPIGSYSLTSHNHDAAYSPVAHNHSALYLPLTGGTLTGNLGIGFAIPAGIEAASRYLQVGLGGFVSGNNGAPNLWLMANSYWGASAARSITNAPGIQLLLGQDGHTRIYTAPAVAPGTDQVLTQRLVLDPNGKLTLIPAGGQHALTTNSVNGANFGSPNPVLHHPSYPGIQVGASTLWNHVTDAASYWSCNSYYLGDGGSGRRAISTGAGGEFAQESGQLIFRTFASVAAGALQTIKQVMSINAAGTLTLSPDAAATGISINTVAEAFIDPYAGQHIGLGLWASAALRTRADGAGWLGTSDRRWIGVYATVGSIQTSTYEAKEAFAPLDPVACATAVLETDWVNFRYLPPPYEEPPTQKGEAPEQRQRKVDESKAAHAKRLVETAPTRKQKGYVLKSPMHKTHDLFGLEDRESASPSSDLAVVACALQGALKRIATLETHILQLEAAR